MKLLCAGKLQPEYEVPDWAINGRRPLENAEPDVQMVASMGRPVPPEFYAVRHVDGKREVVAWGNGCLSTMMVEV